MSILWRKRGEARAAVGIDGILNRFRDDGTGTIADVGRDVPTVPSMSLEPPIFKGHRTEKSGCVREILF